ncbi:hypothetical protein QYE76_007613 [Lolium multiflorum]|uniref:Transposase n=1 Tax=Lolium multiflorum TaxID=4521 RepID=A0AAD8QEH9_LOLMU|nr:hypothetical protein QYE76_007613 [Lolium multiflorum]
MSPPSEGKVKGGVETVKVLERRRRRRRIRGRRRGGLQFQGTTWWLLCCQGPVQCGLLRLQAELLQLQCLKKGKKGKEKEKQSLRHILPPTPTDDDMDQDDAQEDYDLEDNVEYDSEHSFEGGENGADDDEFATATDMWTSNQTLGYMCITSHFITAEWKLTKKVIKFFVVETPHSGIAMFNQLLECIQEWNIEYKIFGITLDNASANDSMVFELRRNLVDKMALPVSGALLHNRCAAHVINLIVQDGLAIVHVKAIVNNIRESVKYIRSSEARKKKFKYVISKAGLPVGKWPTMDTPTRWNSTYLMIETAMEYRRAFDSLAKQDSNYTYAPSEKDWEKAAVLCKVLKVFYDATMVISGTTYPTSNLYFHEMWKVKHTLHNEATNADLGPMVAAMELKFNKYWYSSYLNLAIPVLLDPRFKLKYVEFRLKQAFVNDPQPRIDKVKRTFKNLFNEYFAQLNNGSNFSQPPGQDHSQMATPNDDDIFGDWDNHLNEQMQDQVTTELDRYLSERPISRSGDFDILNWWSTNSGTYPTLAAVARDVLAMPASTVASESVFSMGGRIVTDFRSRLGVESVEALVCSQDWYRGQGPSASHRRMGAITDVVDLNDVETESPLA